MNSFKPTFQSPFKIEFEGISDGSPEYFYGVEGLEASYRTEKYLPGGYATPFEIPSAYQVTHLILRRPFYREKTKITKWCEEALNNSTFQPVGVQIFILNRKEEIVAHWSVVGTYPTGLAVSPLGYHQGSRVVEERITFAYTSISRIK